MTDRQIALATSISLASLIIWLWAAAELDRWLWNRRRARKRGGWIR